MTRQGYCVGDSKDTRFVGAFGIFGSHNLGATDAGTCYPSWGVFEVVENRPAEDEGDRNIRICDRG
jgi:hypothetical protein